MKTQTHPQSTTAYNAEQELQAQMEFDALGDLADLAGYIKFLQQQTIDSGESWLAEDLH